MSKKFLLTIIVVLTLVVAVPVAFGALGSNDDNPTPNSTPSSGNWAGMSQNCSAVVDEAVKQGQITPEQGAQWKEHINQMQEFHEKNGSAGMGGMMGGSGGFGMMNDF